MTNLKKGFEEIDEALSWRGIVGDGPRFLACENLVKEESLLWENIGISPPAINQRRSGSPVPKSVVRTRILQTKDRTNDPKQIQTT